jgi:spore coat polysaccharide biosynthesis protein SpsF
MKTAAIIQARMGSSRLPGKILMDIAGQPMLWHVIERIKCCKEVDQIILATTKTDEDIKAVNVAEKCGIQSYRGSEEDVLKRFYETATKYEIDVIVRITADCPLIDPKIVDTLVKYYKQNNLDYAGLGNPNPCPDGLDAEVFSLEALTKSNNEALLASEKEHVTPFIKKNVDKFKIGYLYHNSFDLSHLRWTVDEKQDLIFVSEVYKKLYHEKNIFLTKDILALLNKEPELLKINSGIIRNLGYIKSLKYDRIVK